MSLSLRGLSTNLTNFQIILANRALERNGAQVIIVNRTLDRLSAEEIRITIIEPALKTLNFMQLKIKLKCNLIAFVGSMYYKWNSEFQPTITHDFINVILGLVGVSYAGKNVKNFFHISYLIYALEDYQDYLNVRRRPSRATFENWISTLNNSRSYLQI